MVRPCILILDENTTHQRLLGLMAKRLGIDSKSFSACEEAVKALENTVGTVYAAVLIDLNIPHNPQAMRCIQAIKALRRLKRLRLPIIAVTAYAMESERQLCMRAGVDDYLSKPFSAQQFTDLMNRWIDGAERRIQRAS
jgi:two-component system, sensor histidine kinase